MFGVRQTSLLPRPAMQSGHVAGAAAGFVLDSSAVTTLAVSGAPAARARAHFCWIFKRPRAGESPTFPGPERRVSHVPLPAVIPLSRKQGSGFEHKARELPALPQLSLCALRVRPSRCGYRYPPPVAGAPGLSSWDFKADAVQGRPLTRRDGEKRPLKAELPDS